MTIWQQLVNAVNVRLATITTANGYSANLGASIHWNPDEDLHADQLPGLIIEDSIQLIDASGVIGRNDNVLQFDIEIQAKGTTAANTIREMVQDVLTAVGAEPTWGGLAYDTSVPSIRMEVESKGKRFAAAALTLNIKYRAATWSI